MENVLTMTAEELIDQLQEVCNNTIKPQDPKLNKNAIFIPRKELINNNKNNKRLAYSGDLTIQNLVINKNNKSISELFNDNLGHRLNYINSLTVSLIIKTDKLSLRDLFRNSNIPHISLTLILSSDVELTSISNMFSLSNIKNDISKYTRSIHIINADKYKLKLTGSAENFINNNGAILDLNELFEVSQCEVLNYDCMLANNKYMVSLVKNDLAMMDLTKWTSRNYPFVSLNCMFCNGSNIRVVDMSNWNTETCLNFNYCFSNTPEMRKIYINNWKLKLSSDSPCDYDNPTSTNPSDYKCEASVLNMFSNCGTTALITSPVKLVINGLTLFILTNTTNSGIIITEEAKQRLIRKLNNTVVCLCVPANGKLNVYSVNK